MASNPFIINASPLIFLYKINGLEWVCRLADSQILVPEAVLQEIAAGDGGDEMMARIKNDPGFSVVANVPIPPVVAAWDLGAGETQVLSQALQMPKTITILDDKAARECAKSLGFNVLGTLGILLIAKRRGWIPAARPVVEELLTQGMFLSPGLIAMALAEVGE